MVLFRSSMCADAHAFSAPLPFVPAHACGFSRNVMALFGRERGCARVPAFQTAEAAQRSSVRVFSEASLEHRCRYRETSPVCATPVSRVPSVTQYGRAQRTLRTFLNPSTRTRHRSMRRCTVGTLLERSSMLQARRRMCRVASRGSARTQTVQRLLAAVGWRCTQFVGDEDVEGERAS